VYVIVFLEKKMKSWIIRIGYAAVETSGFGGSLKIYGSGAYISTVCTLVSQALAVGLVFIAAGGKLNVNVYSFLQLIERIFLLHCQRFIIFHDIWSTVVKLKY